MIRTFFATDLEIGKIDDNGNDVFASDCMRLFGYSDCANDDLETVSIEILLSVAEQKKIGGKIIFYDENKNIISIREFVPGEKSSDVMVVEYPKSSDNKVHNGASYFRFYIYWEDHTNFDFFSNNNLETRDVQGLQITHNSLDKTVTVNGTSTGYICIPWDAGTGLTCGGTNFEENEETATNPNDILDIFENILKNSLRSGGTTAYTNLPLDKQLYLYNATEPSTSAKIKIGLNCMTNNPEENPRDIQTMSSFAYFDATGTVIENKNNTNYVFPFIFIEPGSTFNNERIRLHLYSGLSLDLISIFSFPEWEYIYDIPELIGNTFSDISEDLYRIPTTMWQQNDEFNDGLPYMEMLPGLNFAEKAMKYDDLRLLDEVEVVSYPHGLDTYLPISKIEITPDNPFNSTYTIGYTKKQLITKQVNKK